MDEVTGVFLHAASIDEPVNVPAVLFRNELHWFESQYRHIYIF